MESEIGLYSIPYTVIRYADDTVILSGIIQSLNILCDHIRKLGKAKKGHQTKYK